MQGQAESKMKIALDRTIIETSTRIAASIIPWIPTCANGVQCSNSGDIFITSSGGVTKHSSNDLPKSQRKKKSQPEMIGRSSTNSISAILSNSIYGDDTHAVEGRNKLLVKLVQYRANRRAPWSGKKKNHEMLSCNNREPISIREGQRITSHDRSSRELYSLYDEMGSRRIEQLDDKLMCEISEKYHKSVTQDEVDHHLDDDVNIFEEEVTMEDDREWVEDAVVEVEVEVEGQSVWQSLSCDEIGTSCNDEANNIIYIKSNPRILTDDKSREKNSIIKERGNENDLSKEINKEENIPETLHCWIDSLENSHKENTSINSTQTLSNKDNKKIKKYKANKYFVLKVKILKYLIPSNQENSVKDTKYEKLEKKIQDDIITEWNEKIIEELGILIIQKSSTKKQILISLLNQFPLSLSIFSNLLNGNIGEELKSLPSPLPLSLPVSPSHSSPIIFPTVTVSYTSRRKKTLKENNEINENIKNTLNDTTTNSSNNSIDCNTSYTATNSNFIQNKNENQTAPNNGSESKIMPHKSEKNIFHVDISLKGMGYVAPLDEYSEIVVSFL